MLDQDHNQNKFGNLWKQNLCSQKKVDNWLRRNLQQQADAKWNPGRCIGEVSSHDLATGLFFWT